jgi:hypothetical protein
MIPEPFLVAQPQAMLKASAALVPTCRAARCCSSDIVPEQVGNGKTKVITRAYEGMLTA